MREKPYFLCNRPYIIAQIRRVLKSGSHPDEDGARGSLNHRAYATGGWTL